MMDGLSRRGGDTIPRLLFKYVFLPLLVTVLGGLMVLVLWDVWGTRAEWWPGILERWSEIGKAMTADVPVPRWRLFLLAVGSSTAGAMMYAIWLARATIIDVVEALSRRFSLYHIFFAGKAGASGSVNTTFRITPVDEYSAMGKEERKVFAAVAGYISQSPDEDAVGIEDITRRTGFSEMGAKTNLNTLGERGLIVHLRVPPSATSMGYSVWSLTDSGLALAVANGLDEGH